MVYEKCGNCRRRGAYAVADRGVVRCKYCTASEECKRLHPSGLGAVAAGLHAVDGKVRRRGRLSSGDADQGTRDGNRIAGGVMSMDMATISVLASGGARHRPTYPTASSTPDVAPHAERGELKAVVVDDDAMVRTLVAATLKRAGMTVTQASSGEEGCASILADRPDIAVLDLSMPGMDGLEVLVELRRRCDVGIIVLSGRSNEGDRVVALKLGADDYMAKPFAPADLMARAEAVIAARSAGVRPTSAG